MKTIIMRITFKDLRYGYTFLKKGMLHVNMQILYSCNFRCRICDFWKDPYLDAPRLSLENIEVISRKLSHFGPMMISVGGGEPLLHPDLIPMTKILAKRHFPIMICNGWYINSENSRELFKAGMREVSISVDYADPQKHDEQRGMEGAFDRAINALKILNENRTAPNQRVHMISVVMDDNLDDIEKLIQLAKSIGVTYLVTLYSDSRGKKEAKNDMRDVSQRLLRLKEKYDNFVAIPAYLERFSEAIESESGIDPCMAGINLFNIDSSGNVNLCIDKLDENAGNILTDDIREIEKNLIELNRRNECRSCWTSCRGVFQSLLYGGSKLRNLRAAYETVKDVPIA